MVNLMYDVGSRDEQPGRTGLAHLMEHLMFSGSKHIPLFDNALRQAGGSANAWTSVDATNYYDVVPAQNVATAFWLERDRLLHLSLSDEGIATQRSVVTEEFKQRCLNEPYGDLSHLAHQLAFKVHPYQWPAVGAAMNDIAAITRDDIERFRAEHYAVDNLILCVAGNVSFERAVQLAECWFGDIEPSHRQRHLLPEEPEQTAPRETTVFRPVPNDLLQMSFRMCRRTGSDFIVCDLITDLLANGKSARFTRNVLSKCDVFADLDAAVEGTIDPGLLVIKGRLTDGASMERAVEMVWTELNELVNGDAEEKEIAKCANKFESSKRFENLGCLPKAVRLCQCEQMGDAGIANSELEHYRAVTPDDVKRVAGNVFRKEHCSTIYYMKER